MRRPFLLLTALCAALLVPAPARSQAEAVIADFSARVIVRYKADSPLLRKQVLSANVQQVSQARALGARLGIELRAGADVDDRSHVLFASGMTSRELASRLARESDIEYAVPDQRRRPLAAPSDPLYLAGPAVGDGVGGPAVGQWYLRAPAGEVQSSLGIETAWDYTTGSSNIVVAVIDTGVRFDHPDLLRAAAGGNLLPGYDMISDVDVANDGDGRDADPSDPGDWLTLDEVRKVGGPFEDCSDAAEDSSWHGTQTSGLIGALTNNGVGMASVGRNVRVLPVRALGKCGGFDSDIIAAMRWAAGLSVPGVPANPNRARVLNLSLGGDGACSAAYRNVVAAINAVGAVVVASGGNSAGHAVSTPANCAGVIAVAGLRHVGSKVGFSNLGPEIALGAPAGNCVDIGPTDPCRYPILTTSNSGLTSPIRDAAGGSTYTDSFNILVGTSFSAPLVAGTVALIPSAQEALTPSAVRAMLQATARPFPTTGGDNGDGTPVPQCTAPQPQGAAQIDQLQCYCTTATCGAGMLDAGAAVLAAQRFDLTVTKSGNGTVTSSPAGIICGTDCSENYAGGTNATLTATPNPNAPVGTYIFFRWGGDCSGFGTQSTCTLRMNAAKNATATFSYIGTGSAYSRNYVQVAYVAYYGRPADPGGQGYWATRMDSEGQALNAVIGAFGNSDEFNRRYGGLTNTQLVTKIYQQALGRDPDQGGLDWYVAELLAGRRTLQTITLDVLNGATTAPDSTVVANKLTVAAYYTAKVAAGCPYGTEQDGVDVITVVTALPASVADAETAIDAGCGP